MRVTGATGASKSEVGARVQPLRGLHPVRALLREWLLELKVMGRSQRTIDWYAQKMDWYRRSGGAKNLEELNAFELKRFLAEQQERGLSDNTIHGFFQVIRSFANWCEREEYPLDRSVLRMRPPKVALKEMSTYTPEQVALIFDSAKVGWPQLAVKILLGTGIRVGELVNLLLEDVEDDEDAMFLKIKRGKGAKFRRVPISQRLRREIIRYINRSRPDSDAPNLLLLANGRPVSIQAVCDLLQRLRRRLGFPLHAHRFRHTFATEYLRRGGRWNAFAASSATRPTQWSCATSTWTRTTWVAISTRGRPTDVELHRRPAEWAPPIPRPIQAGEAT